MEATTQNDQLGSRGSDFGSGEEEAGAESDVEDNADAGEEEEETGMAEQNKVGCHPTFNSDIASPTGIHQTQQPEGEESDSELRLQHQQKDNHQSREHTVRNELMTQMREEFEENGREQSADYESQLEAKQRIIEELHQKLREATADNWRPAESPELSNGHRELESLKNELVKLEQKLANANQEKDYYKKHFRGEEQNGGGDGDHGHNGRPRYEDDFGKELLLVNKRNYQLENRTRKLELELREAQQRMAHMGDNLKSAERLLWLEKERSATLEMEREQLNSEIGELRRNSDALRRELEMFRGEGGGPPGMANNEQMEEEIARVRRDCDLRVAEIRDMKNKLDWRLGEVSQQFHDTKWRLGEVEATLAHRDWELEQANNRIKQLESSLGANESALVRDEAEKLRDELARATEEKGQMQWRLGELAQWWNDAKWRVGELEAETTQRSHLLDRAHHRIGELERILEGNATFTERRNSELEQSRIGELEAELGAIGPERQELERIVGELKEQKSKVEWRLGEVTQWWNDAKWRIGELEACQRWNGGAEKLAELESSNRRTKSLLQDGTLLIRKQPHRDRHKWKVLTMEHLLDSPPSRVWFETAAEGAKEVYLIGSFTNWECALLCESIPEKPERRGLWLDLPAGRHEFRFLRDGQWHTEEQYADCWTEHGTKNNWIHVA